MDLNGPPHVVPPESLQPPPPPLQRSTWHSPVPYLFGGLAAMLGLIAFALFVLACSYWKLSSYLDSEDAGDEERGVGRKTPEGRPTKVVHVFQEKVAVIMAGDDNPTFLATPMRTRVCSGGDDEEARENKKKKMVRRTKEDDDKEEDGAKGKGREEGINEYSKKGSIQEHERDI